MSPNEYKQCIAFLTALRWEYDLDTTAGPTLRFIEMCDLLEVSYILNKQLDVSRYPNSQELI